VSLFTIPRLEKLDSQPEVQKLLKGLLANPGVQTFLWSGPEGSGKKTYALSLVRSLFCQEGPACAGCATCRQVLSKTHPDLFWVHRDHFWAEDPEEKKKNEITIKVAQHLSEKLHRAPFSAPLKVAVILDAEELNEQAQNALLKTLEEPPAKTLIILLAQKTGDFLPTVLSRCRPIRFPALPVKVAESLLIQSYGWDKARAHQAAQEAHGNLTLGLKFGDETWAQFREKVGTDFDKALQGPDEEWLTLVSEYEQWEPDFLGERELTATQRKAEVLTAALQVYLGLWSRRLSGEAETPAKLSSLSAGSILQCLQKHQDMIPAYLNSRMILDHLFLELREGFRKGELPNRSFAEMSIKI
jgi:DNA polymerase III subunit delta'